ncbi:MAG: TlpA family protein disulfide reductase [Polaribacter sp.]
MQHFKKIALVFILFLTSCHFETPTEFSEKALNDTALSLDGTSIRIKKIIQQYKGKKILIDVWASWCADCIKGLPKIKDLQKEFPKVVFLFLSVDKNNATWKKAIQRFQIKGKHYNLPNGMKDGDFVDFIRLNWIPRYLVINENGFVDLFKATKATDKNIVLALKK